jgi:hypothetical protein
VLDNPYKITGVKAVKGPQHPFQLQHHS